MRTEVFLRRDVAAVIQAIMSAHSDLATRLPSRDAVIYSAGFAAAIRAVAAAFHINLELELDDSCLASLTPANDDVLHLSSGEWRVIPIDTSALTCEDS
jgi:hypothetical protein